MEKLFLMILLTAISKSLFGWQNNVQNQEALLELGNVNAFSIYTLPSVERDFDKKGTEYFLSEEFFFL